jgi:predicted kinase
MKSLFIMCGCPGSGKSTWVQEQIKETKYETAWVSRDAIRFSMVAEDEEYFSKEDDVFRIFCETIQKELDAGKVVFADATHLNEKSRNKTLDKLNLDDVKVFAVNFNLPVEICLKQNENRRGTRAYVPRSVIRRMHCQYVEPSDNEKYDYTNILNITIN